MREVWEIIDDVIKILLVTCELQVTCTHNGNGTDAKFEPPVKLIPILR
jgi:hypothetical protein